MIALAGVTLADAKQGQPEVEKVREILVRERGWALRDVLRRRRRSGGGEG